jgi:hypothetical protein
MHRFKIKMTHQEVSFLMNVSSMTNDKKHDLISATRTGTCTSIVEINTTQNSKVKKKWRKQKQQMNRAQLKSMLLAYCCDRVSAVLHSCSLTLLDLKNMYHSLVGIGLRSRNAWNWGGGE